MSKSDFRSVNTYLNNQQLSEHLYNTDAQEIGRPDLSLEEVKHKLKDASAQQVIEWAAETFGNGLVISTSFGIQAAVMLHLATRVVPNISVIWVDTGYLPAETYRFAQELTERLNLNLKVYQSSLTPARMEALYGKLWEHQNVNALNRYDFMRKVEPMQRALKELNSTAWLAGLRRQQTEHRKSLETIALREKQYKIHPILDWNSRDVYNYLTVNELPYHPYFEKGYVSVGDWHSSRPMKADDNNERDTRFHGLKQECGLHLPLSPEVAESLDSSNL
ncbi:MAG: phosphoadenylylsulfate reductase (thioredoxin) [Candidatus Atelocyanobacterium thalassa isolate SIO64986]|uniref:Phosphoadenosine 5'-phosphosulfate reductase n=1 Tax=Candidatus Atelocyanobacterium thalassa isolate SIO64986 TaxID=1527444 RepID=A0A086CI31_9CHRO|nr:MAG: phosphoadenylylsulfate reductase (thioredoxin) [Candidatus Atelocyanobacterium thalassa isolate SIO64986]